MKLDKVIREIDAILMLQSNEQVIIRPFARAKAILRREGFSERTYIQEIKRRVQGR